MKRILATALALLLAGCGGSHLGAAGVKQASGVAAQGGHVVVFSGAHQLYVMPDAGTSPILQAIRVAQRSIHMEMYLLMPGGVDQAVLDALVAKARAGVDVSVILDGSTNDYPEPPSCQPPANPARMNQPAYDALAAAGAHVRWSSTRFRFTHQKSMVIDGEVAYVMTMNLSSSAFTRNREYVVGDQVGADVAETERIFQADWADRAYTPVDPHLVVSPTNSRSRIIGLIDGAKQSVTLEVEYLTDAQVLSHLAARQKAGVTVTAMLSYQAKDPCSGYDANAKELAALQKAGITRVAFPQALTMHAKAILVDGTHAYIGSENFTSNSLDGNRELGILVDDPLVIQPLAATLAKDWATRDAAPSQAVESFGEPALED